MGWRAKDREDPGAEQRDLPEDIESTREKRDVRAIKKRRVWDRS